MIAVATATLFVALLLTAAGLARMGGSRGRHARNGADCVTVWQLRARMATELDRDFGFTHGPRVRSVPRVPLAA